MKNLLKPIDWLYKKLETDQFILATLAVLALLAQLAVNSYFIHHRSL